ncbi:unnamed protein product [Clonostachys rosea]|uniref:ABM domain-containing protein n=1 Tax=Bionectria ochroleuca TaxID=29856 RepID=A0ABY6UFL9_BIOOC|nr:unnamed protein product [Clonostachys rosea]
MAITELVFLHPKPSHDHLELLECFMEYLESQDEWSRQHQPHIHRGERKENLSTLFITTTDPLTILMISPWDSLQAQEEWLQFEEDEGIFKKLGQVVVEEHHDISRFYVHPVSNLREVPDVRDIASPVELCVMSTSEVEERTVLAEFDQLDKVTLEGGGYAWGGWKLNKSGDTPKFVCLVAKGGNPLSEFVDRVGLSAPSNVRCFHPLV